MTDPPIARRGRFDRGEDVQIGRDELPLAQAVEKHYFGERFPFEPFGDVWQDYQDGDERRRRQLQRQRQRAGLNLSNATGGPAVAAPEATAGDGKDEL